MRNQRIQVPGVRSQEPNLIIKTLIHILSKIIKFLFYGSVTTVLFIVVCGSSMIMLSYLSTEKYNNSESPHRLFTVVLESFDESLDHTRFDCFKWDDFKKMHPKDHNIYIDVRELTCGDHFSYFETEYSASLSVNNGSCYNISSNFEVENIGLANQKIKLRWAQEAYKVRNDYYVVDSKIVPLYFRKFVSDTIVIFGFLLGCAVTLIIIIAFRFYMRRHKKLRAKTQADLSADS